jgi:hypothetical protein
MAPTTAHRHEESRDSRRKAAPSLQIEAEDAEAVVVWADDALRLTRSARTPQAVVRVYARLLKRPSEKPLVGTLVHKSAAGHYSSKCFIVIFGYSPSPSSSA